MYAPASVTEGRLGGGHTERFVSDSHDGDSDRERGRERERERERETVSPRLTPRFSISSVGTPAYGLSLSLSLSLSHTHTIHIYIHYQRRWRPDKT
jgi:hypothetical protein